MLFGELPIRIRLFFILDDYNRSSQLCCISESYDHKSVLLEGRYSNQLRINKKRIYKWKMRICNMISGDGSYWPTPFTNPKTCFRTESGLLISISLFPENSWHTGIFFVTTTFPMNSTIPKQRHVETQWVTNPTLFKTLFLL